MGQGVISQKTEKLSHVLRHYRNFIHPNREYKEEDINEAHASISANVLNIFIHEIKQKYGESCDYNHEEVLDKIISDKLFSEEMLEQIIEQMSDKEKEKLLHSLVLKQYIDRDYLAVGGFEYDSHWLESEGKKFINPLKKVLSNDSKLFFLKKMVNEMKLGSRDTSFAYFNLFYDEISLLDEKKRAMVIFYILRACLKI